MIATITIVKATHAHIDHVAEHMRQADRSEIMASAGRLPAGALAYSLDRSDFAYTGCINGVPACMFGCGTINLLCRTGVPWLLGTDLVERHYRQFARHSKRMLGIMACRYDRLVNAVDDRNELSKRWLAWLGFSIGEPIIMGVEKRPFRVFELRCGNV